MAATKQRARTLEIHQEILHFIREFARTQGYAPTLGDVAVGCGRAKSVVKHHLEQMRARKLVTWERHKSRTLRVL